ncbi:PREDICTED: uncharacterized protein LOC108972413 [Bactrocera latifrons]|uniref:uncharacterized protein LOC108972413 n=1 Tax=Bactrocera latifrons TaxID=174628 RepID=UPI0008DCADE9|nr:PREDICTED: uncharacterized protein LOC108972413 [Bactrocera latifrons]
MASGTNWIYVIIGVCLLLSLVSNTFGKSATDDKLAQTSIRKARSAQLQYPPPRQPKFLGRIEYEFRKEFNRPGSPYQHRDI